jgi:hypothetical protein
MLSACTAMPDVQLLTSAPNAFSREPVRLRFWAIFFDYPKLLGSAMVIDNDAFLFHANSPLPVIVIKTVLPTADRRDD